MLDAAFGSQVDHHGNLDEVYLPIPSVHHPNQILLKFATTTILISVTCQASELVKKRMPSQARKLPSVLELLELCPCRLLLLA